MKKILTIYENDTIIFHKKKLSKKQKAKYDALVELYKFNKDLGIKSFKIFDEKYYSEFENIIYSSLIGVKIEFGQCNDKSK